MAISSSSLPDKPVAPLAPGAFAIVFSVSFVMAVGNTGMQSVLPAIGREVEVPDALITAVYSLSALLWAVGAPFWAARADRFGRRPLMMIGLVGFAVSMLLCTAVIAAGSYGLIAPAVFFVLFLFARALFGFFGSAAPPASQAYLAERTDREKRTDAIAGLAGAFGLGTIVGPAIAPLFILPFLDLSGPTFAFALIATGVLGLVMFKLPETWPPPGHAEMLAAQEAEDPAPVGKPPPMWRDRRVRPFLIYGLLVSSCQTAQYQTLGFLIIDELSLPPLEAQTFIAIAMMAGALAGLFAQWGLIRVFRLNPRFLLRWGVILAGLANIVMVAIPNYWVVVVAFALSSLGYGFARPGFTAGASLAVGNRDQARAAGAVASVMGLNVIAAPLFVVVYGKFSFGPYLINVIILGAMLIYVFKNPLLRYAGEMPTTERQTASSVERNDASSGF
jgi:MFS family permease